MNASVWKWDTKLTWADVPALLLTGVSAVTVMAGARLLRGQNQVLMLALGVGVAGATFVLEKRLVERMNSIRPKQSLLSLVLCWLPLFLFATVLATFATFSWIAPEIAQRDLDESRRAHWTNESNRVGKYLLDLQTALRRQAPTTQRDIGVERRRAAAARYEGIPHAPEPLRALQQNLAAVRELERRVPTVQRLPLDLPTDEARAREQVDRVFRDLADLHASAVLATAGAPALPNYEPFVPPPSDLQSVVAEETRKRSWRAMTAWGAALWVELLPLFALWRGGRRVPLAARIVQWRCRVIEIFDALLGRHTATPLPILIEPLQVRGVVRVALPGEYTLTDCTPLLEEAVGTLTGLLGAYELHRISNARGDNLDENLPLLPQLDGEPLVLSVVEGRQ
jgi:hypothetical protein